MATQTRRYIRLRELDQRIAVLEQRSDSDRLAHLEELTPLRQRLAALEVQVRVLETRVALLTQALQAHGLALDPRLRDES